MEGHAGRGKRIRWGHHPVRRRVSDSMRPPTGSRPYRRAPASFARRSSSDHGGRQALFQPANTFIASSSPRANPRTRRQHTRKVAASPCCPATAGGIVAMYFRARSRTSDECLEPCLVESGAGCALAVCCNGKSRGLNTRRPGAYSIATMGPGRYLWLKNPGIRVT